MGIAGFIGGNVREYHLVVLVHRNAGRGKGGVFVKTRVIVVVVVLGVFLGSLCCSGNAASETNKREITLSSGSKDAFVQQIQEVEDGRFVLDKDAPFSVEAWVEPICTLEKTVYAEHPLSLDDPVWECREYPCSRSWSFDLADKSLSIDAYPHLILSWDQAVPDNIPQVSVALDAQTASSSESEQEKKTITHFQGEYDASVRHKIKPLSTIDMIKVGYTEKSRLYLLKREWGIKTDNQWRYSQDGKNLVLQSRIDLPVDQAQILQVVTDSKCPADLVQFSLDTDGNGRRDRFLLFPETRHSVETHGDISILTVDIAASIRALGMNPDKVVIMEPLLFLPTDYSIYTQTKPLKKLIFGTEKQPECVGRIVPKVQVTNQSVYLDFDFSPVLESSRLWNGQWHRMMVTVQSKKPQRIQWKKIAFMDDLQTRVPILESVLEQALAGWGRPAPSNGLDRIQSFYPLMYNHVQQQLTREPFSDRDLEITGKNVWYQIDKQSQSIRIHGFFSDSDSQLCLTLPLLSQQAKLSVKGDIAVSMKNMPVAFPSRQIFTVTKDSGQLEQEPLNTLIVTPERKCGRVSNLQWDVILIVQPPDIFEKAVFPEIRNQPVTKHWISPIETHYGNLWACYSGVQSLYGDLIYRKDDKNIRFPFVLGDDVPGIQVSLPIGAHLTGFEPELTRKIQSNRPSDYTSVWFDLQLASRENPPDFHGMEWWDKDGEIPLIASDKSMVTDGDDQKVYLFRHGADPMNWTFVLPDTAFMLARQLVLPSPMPAFCRLVLKINDKTWELPQDISVWDVPDEAGDVKSLSLTLASRGREPMLVVSPPVLRVTGVRRTTSEDLSQIGIVLDGRKIHTKGLELPDPKGGWVKLADLKLAAGTHRVDMLDSRYFRIKKLKFHTDAPAPWPESKSETVPDVPLWRRLLNFAFKMLMVVGVGFGIYRFRRPIGSVVHWIWQPIWRKTTHLYGRLSDRTWTFLWLSLSCGLYTMGLFKPSQGENFGATFGGMAVVFGLWHISRWCRGRLTEKFPKIAAQVYYNRSKPFFAWALIMLVLTALLLAVKLEPLAEQAAIIVYYLLVVGTVGEVVALRRSGQRGDGELKHDEC